MSYFLGLDVGTQGARALVCDEKGRMIAQGVQSFGIADSALPAGRSEQDPETWWWAVSEALRQVFRSFHGEITATAVDSTSGTIVPVDADGNPTRSAIMYNDGRAVEEAAICNDAGQELTGRLGYRFGASFGLPKILWVMKNQPEVHRRTKRYIHAADFIVGRLTGDYGMSDYSNALKTGYDLERLRWPEFIPEKLGLPLSMLPEVVTPGERIGRVSEEAERLTGLRAGTVVTAGVSDGTAGFVASGASEVGDWNSTLGTTLVLRGVSRELIKDPEGRIYCHRHPDGWWLPGGASNVGGECLERFFAGADYRAMDAAAAERVPTNVLVYPLARKGERLPFVDPNAEGVVWGTPRDLEELYAAYLQGVAFVERWSLELMAELGADTSGTVYATGGGAKSLEWMKIRANVLGKRLARPAITESAMGAAIVAASRACYSSLSEADRSMVKVDAEFVPDDVKTEMYDLRYNNFREKCRLHHRS